MMVADYLRLKYASVIFASDIGSGIKMTMHQAVRAKRLRSSRAMPDMTIYEARQGKAGLLLEFKREGTKIRKKDGSLVADPHIREQHELHERLRGKGYAVHFVTSFGEARTVIDGYLEDESVSLFEF